MREGKVLAANLDGAYVIRLDGDVRLTLCTSIDDYFQRMYDDPAFVSVVVDLCTAQGIDSTTLGLLAGLALHVKEHFGFTPSIYSCDPSINRLLRSMAFQTLFELHEEACSDPEDIAEIPDVRGGEEAVKQQVIDAHKVLMGVSDENHARFKDLLTALEKG